MDDEDILEVVVTDTDEDVAVVTQEETDTPVVDNGQVYESAESAIIARDEANKAKLWAKESERQAGLSAGSATSAAEARDDVIGVREYIEDFVEEVLPILDGLDKIMFGMYKRSFTSADWVLDNGKYFIAFDKNIITGVYKVENNVAQLVTNIDIVSDSNNVKIYSQQAFTGYGLFVNSGEASTYTHEQAIASDAWEVNHNLNRYPSVTVVDSSGKQFTTAVEYIDENNLIIRMNGATTGTAYLN